MNSKTIINIWQKSFKKHKGSLLNVTDKLRNSGHNWLMESGVKGKFQKGFMMGKDWNDSQISSIKHWAMDVHLGPDQMSKIYETERKETIKTLNELRKKLDRICVGANYGKVIGNSGEILGYSGAVIGCVMSLCGISSGSDIANIGNLVRLGGTFIDIASKITESRFSEKYLKKVEEHLRKDKEFSEILEYTIQIEIEARVKAITGMSPSSKKWNIVVTVCRELCKLASSGMDRNEALNLIKQGKYSKHIGNDVQIETLEKLYDNISAFPLLANRISSSLSVFNLKPEYSKMLTQILIVFCGFEDIYISLYCKGNPDGYSECDSKCDPEGDSKSFPGGDPEVDSKGDTEVDSKADPEDNPEITTARKVSYSNFFRAINLAHSYKSLIHAASTIRRGVSQHSDALKGIVEAINKKYKF